MRSVTEVSNIAVAGRDDVVSDAFPIGVFSASGVALFFSLNSKFFQTRNLESFCSSQGSYFSKVISYGRQSLWLCLFKSLPSRCSIVVLRIIAQGCLFRIFDSKIRRGAKPGTSKLAQQRVGVRSSKFPLCCPT